MNHQDRAAPNVVHQHVEQPQLVAEAHEQVQARGMERDALCFLIEVLGGRGGGSGVRWSARVQSSSIKHSRQQHAHRTHLEQLKRAINIVPYPDVLVQPTRCQQRLADGGLHACDLTVVEGGYHVVEAKVAAFAVGGSEKGKTKKGREVVRGGGGVLWHQRRLELGAGGEEGGNLMSALDNWKVKSWLLSRATTSTSSEGDKAMLRTLKELFSFLNDRVRLYMFKLLQNKKCCGKLARQFRYNKKIQEAAAHVQVSVVGLLEQSDDAIIAADNESFGVHAQALHA